jgi:hypothetical protein
MRRVVVSVAVVLGVMASGGWSAEARTRTTHYYTINAAPPTPSSSALFLGLGPSYNPRQTIRLTPYAPGRLDLHWTPAPNAEWPGFDTVRGGWSAPFGFEHGSVSSWLKFVNRASGMCLTLGSRFVNATAVVESRCDTSGSGLTNEMWFLPVSALGTRTDEISLRQGTSSQTKCLDVTDFRYVANTPLQGWACQPSGPWNQRFRFALVATVTCEIGVTNGLCGLARQP